jgi:hypothetical protein
MKCFECDSDNNIIQHHIVPRSKGGIRTISLCQICHDKVHDITYRNISISELTKKGLIKAKKKGVKLGNPNPKKSVKLMNKGAYEAKIKHHTYIYNIIKPMLPSTLQQLCNYLNDNDIVTKTQKGVWKPAQIRNVLTTFKINSKLKKIRV